MCASNTPGRWNSWIDGSAGEVHAGYWLCSILGAEVHGSELTPLCQQLFSVRAQEFVSQNDEILGAIA